MTWLEWMDSSYNTNNYTLLDLRGCIYDNNNYIPHVKIRFDNNKHIVVAEDGKKLDARDKISDKVYTTVGIPNQCPV